MGSEASAAMPSATDLQHPDRGSEASRETDGREDLEGHGELKVRVGQRQRGPADEARRFRVKRQSRRRVNAHAGSEGRPAPARVHPALEWALRVRAALCSMQGKGRQGRQALGSATTCTE